MSDRRLGSVRQRPRIATGSIDRLRNLLAGDDGPSASGTRQPPQASPADGQDEQRSRDQDDQAGESRPMTGKKIFDVARCVIRTSAAFSLEADIAGIAMSNN